MFCLYPRNIEVPKAAILKDEKLYEKVIRYYFE